MNKIEEALQSILKHSQEVRLACAEKDFGGAMSHAEAIRSYAEIELSKAIAEAWNDMNPVVGMKS